jgi:Uma2 family endonuclease
METVSGMLTAEQFRLLPSDGTPKELVRGRVVPVNVPAPRHGEICAKVVRLVGNFAEDHELGRVVSNDSGVVTERDPDSVRGADVAYYSYLRVPKGPLPEGYLDATPELIFEVRSPTDRWKKVLAKVVEYLNAGVAAVCVLDSQTATAHVYSEDRPTQIFQSDQDLELADFLPGLRVSVSRFFR